MQIAIIGLGLIGGSLAKALKENTEHTVIGFDRDENTLLDALSLGAIDSVGSTSLLENADVVYVCLYPADVVRFVEENAPHFKEGCIVTDVCGIKNQVCGKLTEIAKNYPFVYVGGHPMAGTQYSGFANSKADLFQGAPMVVIPRERDDILLLDRVKKLLTPAGFSHMTVTTAEHHDAMIAYTSQMCHVLSNAYVKSPRAQMHKGYSAGSYRDLTRVAWLTETMWTDLFLENRDYLLEELDRMIGYLGEYRDALEQGNGDRLCTLLAEGRICKEKVDAE